MKRLVMGCLMSAVAATAAVAKESPVRGFPTGDEVLDRKCVPYDQVEPHLVYETNGFDGSIMSKVPPVEQHPRVVMSPEDVPRIRENIRREGVCKRAWERIVLANVQDKKGNLKPAREARVDFAALYALITDDKVYAAQAVEAVVAKSDAVAASLKESDAIHPYPQHWWFTVRNSGVKELARAYDYAYNFMNDAQRAKVRAVISKATVGRYNHGMELPRAWRTWNWPQFSQDMVNTALAIEGEEGYEPRIFEVCKEAVVDFLTYKISPEGWDFEATGYNGLAWGGGGVQSLQAIMRRVTPNPMMHPHLQAQLYAYLGQQGGPEGPYFGRGDSGSAAPQFELTHLMRAFYPNEPGWKAIWAVSRNEKGFGPEAKRLDTRGSMCIPMLLYAVPDDEDPRQQWGRDSELPLTYEAASRGYMATRSSWDPEDSIHMSFANYTKLRDTGHDGPDAGTFSIWGHGINWSRNGDKYHKFSAYRAYVAVDGGGMEYGTAHGLFRPVVDEAQATAARGDQTYCFSWHLANGRYNVLYSPMFEEDPSNYLNQWARNAVKELRKFEPDPMPFSREFWSLASPNYGLWSGEDRHPTRRYPNLPMQRAFRSATLVRGDTSLNDGLGYPYVLTVDDIQQDDESHLYTWLMPLAGENEVVRKSSEKDTRATEIVVRRIPEKPKGAKEWPPPLKKGDAVLMVLALERNASGYPSIELDENRIVVPSISVAPDFKVLVYPHRHGDPTPIATWNEGKTSLKIEIGKQVDTIDFTSAHVDRRPFGGHGTETYYTVARGGKELITVGGPPSLPRVTTPAGEFVGKTLVAFDAVRPGETIRYTTDGSEPTAKSTLYTGPFEIDETTTVKAITHAADWNFGDPDSDGYRELVSENFIANKPASYRLLVSDVNPKASAPVTFVYTKVVPQGNDAEISALSPGVALSLYELPITSWRGAAIDLESPLMPDSLEDETPIFRTYQQNLTVPRVQPTVDERKMYQGLYVFSGYLKVARAGRYRFRMKSCGPTRLTVGDKRVIDIPGPFHVRLTEREGDVILDLGLHRFEATFADPSYFVSPKLPVVDFALSVKVPGDHRFVAVAPEELFRDKDLAFSIPDTVLETGRPLVIEDQLGGGLEVSTGDRFEIYKKPLVFDDVQNVQLKVRRGKDGAVISKPVSVVKRIPALASVPSLKRGMVRQRYLLPVTAEFDLDGSHTGGHGKQVIKHPKHTDGDIFARAAKAKAEETVVVHEMLPDNVGGVIRQYTGYWWAPETGVYTFMMNNEGSNKLLIDGVHVASNHNQDARPEGKVILEPGWHQFVVMYENSYPGIRMQGPTGEADMLVSDFYYPADINQELYVADDAGKPASFLLGAWFRDGKEQDDRRMSSEVFGAEPAETAGHKGAVRFSGDKSMILVRELSQTSQDFTLSMWIKPEGFEKNKLQYLWNRQKVGWVYSQRGGAFLRIQGDRLSPGFHGRNRPPTLDGLEAGKWQHIAMTIKSDVPKSRALAELWLNGEKIWSELHPNQLNIPTYYMELFAQVDREHTNLFKTQRLGYDDVKDELLQNCFKGEAAEVRLYDAALPPEAIKVLAEGER